MISAMLSLFFYSIYFCAMFFKLFFIALPIFFAIDMTWLGVIAKNVYRQQMGALMTDQVNWIAAISFYVLFLCGLVVFVIMPAVQQKSWTSALTMGAFFGLVTYATYDLTNLAVLKNWPLPITIIDMLWGAVLAASVSTLTYFIAQKIG